MWRSEIERIDPNKPHVVWGAFLKRVSEFHGAESNIGGLFRGDEFTRSVNALRRIESADILECVEGDPRDVVCRHLDTLKRVCK